MVKVEKNIFLVKSGRTSWNNPKQAADKTRTMKDYITISHNMSNI